MIADKYLYKFIEGETFHIIDQDGTPGKLDPGLPRDVLLKMYRFMVQARSFDDKALKLQRSGRMGTYPPLSGQEAVQIGSAMALSESDWIVPSYREGGAMMVAGIPMKQQYMMWMGNDLGNRIPDGVKCLPISIPVGSQILHAAGMGWAANIKKEKMAVLCYFGDGATSRGDFHEGLNFASVFNSPAVFMCSNNQFAISTPVSMQMHSKTIAQKAISYGMRGYRLDGMDALASYVLTKDALDRARNGEGPTLIEALCYRFGPHTTADDPTLYRSAEEVKRMEQNDPTIRFKNYITKKGFWDETQDKALHEEIDALVDKAAKEAEQAPLPTMEDLFKNVFATMPEYLKEEADAFTGAGGGDDMLMNNVQAVNDALMFEMEKDPSVMVIGEDVGHEGGVFRATTGLQKKYGKERVVDTPLSENGIVGASVGLALNGMKPVAEIQFSGFVLAAYDQVMSHASRLRQRSMGRFHVPMVLRMPFGGGVKALEHHSESDETIFIQIPGLKVVAPVTPTDMKGLLISAIRDPDPVIFLEHIRLYRAYREEVTSGELTVPIGKARIALPGKDLTIIAWGAMVNVSLEAAKQLKTEGIEPEVIDLRTLKPLDKNTILDSVKKTGRVVIVEESHRISGFASDIAAIIGEQAILYLKAPVTRVSGYDIRFPLFKLEDQYLPDPGRVISAVKEVIGF